MRGGIKQRHHWKTANGSRSEWSLLGLEDIVDCFWHVQSDACHLYRILPDGCVDIVYQKGEFIVVGPMTTSACVSVGQGENIYGIRFRPGAARRFIGLLASEVCDKVVPVSDVPAISHIASSVYQEPGPLSARKGAATRSRHDFKAPLAFQMEELIVDLKKMAETCRVSDSVIAHATSLLVADPSQSLCKLARDIGWSARHLRRRFLDDIGYSPRTFARIQRFQNFLASARRRPVKAALLADLSAECGYADQAHLTRECRVFSGLTPSRMLQEMSVAFKTGTGDLG